MGKKKKIPAIVKQIKQHTLKEINYAFEKSISYSQLSMFNACPHKWSLQYKDGYYVSESSIHMTFGTALHEALQHYITTIYEVSGAEADRINIEEYFEDRFREVYLKDYSIMIVDCDRGMDAELSEIFSFFVPGYKFMPAYKNRIWDAKICLFNSMTNELNACLFIYLYNFANYVRLIPTF